MGKTRNGKVLKLTSQDRRKILQITKDLDEAKDGPTITYLEKNENVGGTLLRGNLSLNILKNTEFLLGIVEDLSGVSNRESIPASKKPSFPRERKLRQQPKKMNPRWAYPVEPSSKTANGNGH